MISIKEFCQDNQYCFILEEDGDVLSKCFYDPRTAEIFGIERNKPSENVFNIALLKAVLSSLEYKGHKQASAKERLDDKWYNEILQQAGFVLNNEKNVYTLSLEGYFDKPCGQDEK